MTEAEFLSTGYLGLQTGILGITALFTLVFAYVGGLHLFLRIFGALIGIATLSFVTVETFRARK